MANRTRCVSLFLLVLPASLALAQAPETAPETAARDEDRLSSRVFVEVKRFVFEGNTVFTDQELSAVVASYTGRSISSEELEEARRALTVHYIEKGYINSGATLPDQVVRDGVIRFQIHEGVLTEIVIEGNRWLRPFYLRDRIELGAGPPLNLNELKDRLEILRQSPLLKRIHAELRPGLRPGESYLDTQIEEALPIQLGLQFSNRRPPSIGAERFDLLFWHRNLSGIGDALAVEYGITKNGLEDIEFAGTDEVSISYTAPVSARDSTLSLFYSRSDIVIIEEAFEELDISSDLERYGFTLRRPLYRTPSTEYAMAITAERLHNENFLESRPFSFSPGADLGEMNVTALRWVQEWSTRTLNYAVAARSTLSIGLDLLDSTDVGGRDIPDGKFLAWLGQFQYVQKLFGTENQLLFRVSTQLADDPLLSLEQFSLGGLYTVRGYRENQLIRDGGVVGSVELRIPIWYDSLGRGILSLDPFFDIGYGWTDDRDLPEEEYISSAGVGLIFHPGDRVDLQFYWGIPFRKFDSDDDDLQDHGIHFLARLLAF